MISTDTLSEVLINFHQQEYRFASQAELNDMWLTLQFDDPAFERAIVSHIKTQLERYYTGFRRGTINQHC